MTILNPTHTIFKSNKINFYYDVENDNRKIIASKDIFKGDLLILEHGISDIIDGSINRTALNILYNEDFYKELYPRNYKYDLNNIINNITDDEINYTDAINNKISKNVFRHPIDNEKSLFILFRDIVKFNHSTNPNANHSYIKIQIPNIDIPVLIYFIVCSRDILKDEEITINYGNGYFNENIDLKDYENKNQDYFIKNSNKIKKLIFNYLNSNDFKDVIYNHHLYSNGLVYSNNKYIGMPTFYKLLKGDENAEINIKEMNDWINTEIIKLSHYIQLYIKSIKNNF